MTTFLNELSLPNTQTKTDAINLFNELGVRYKECRVNGVRDLRVCSTFYNHEFAPNFPFAEWLQEHTVDQDLRTLINSVTGTLPNAEGVLIGYENDNSLVLQMEVNEIQCIGLGLASEAIFNTLAFSFGATNWGEREYIVSLTDVAENEDGNIEEHNRQSESRNVSTANHSAIHQAFIQKKVSETIQNGTELWLRSRELFPNLNFLGNVRNQLTPYNANTVGFQQIINRLYNLQNVASAFTGNPIQCDDFPTYTTPESTTRENTFRNQLTFRCPDGEERLFTWHSRFTPGAGRIHFFPFEAEKKIIIGYIGTKIQ